MNKKERVKSILAGKKADCIPSCFSLHFPKDCVGQEAIVEAHLKFFVETDTDIIKIMNENLVRAESVIHEAEDLVKIPAINMDTEYMNAQISLTKEILKKASSDTFSIGTLHGICASSIHPLEQQGMEYLAARKFILTALRNNPEPVLKYFDNITEGLCKLAKAYIEAGVDGIYYAALGGERDLLSDEEFEKWYKPYDLKILQTIKDSGGYTFLHICKDNLNMERYREYAKYADVVNWGVYEAPYSMEDSENLFDECVLMGGLPNRSGVMIDGSQEDLEKAVYDVVKMQKGRPFILGADCTLPTEIPYNRIRSIVDKAHTMQV